MAATRDTVLANFDDDGSGEGFITQSDQKTAAGQLWDYTKEVDNRTLSGGGGDLTTAAHALIDHTGIPGVGAGGGGDHPDADHADAFSPIGHDHDADYSPTAHNHAGTYDPSGTAAAAITAHHAASSTDHDDRYYTEGEVDTALAGKENTGVAASAVATHESTYDHTKFISSSDGTITETIALTQTAYNAIGTKSTTTHYLIVG